MLTVESIVESVAPQKVSVTGGLRSQRASPAPQPLLGTSQAPFHSVKNTSFVLLQEGSNPVQRSSFCLMPVFKTELGFISYQDPALHLLYMLICSGKITEKQIIVLIKCSGKPPMSPLGLIVESVTVLPCASV